jgi:2-isopropylmalate synthase
VIRVNSQSGKGGIAYLLETEYGVELPRRAQIDLARNVQRHSESSGAEVSAAQLWDIFRSSYLIVSDPRVTLERLDIEGHRVIVSMSRDGSVVSRSYDDAGPIEALAAALGDMGIDVDVKELHQTSVREGSSSEALTMIEYRAGGETGWAAGMDRSVLAASAAAMLTAANRAVAQEEVSA